MIDTGPYPSTAPSSAGANSRARRRRSSGSPTVRVTVRGALTGRPGSGAAATGLAAVGLGVDVALHAVHVLTTLERGTLRIVVVLLVLAFQRLLHPALDLGRGILRRTAG